MELAMFYSAQDSARFSNDLSNEMRCIFSQISRLAIAPALETGHDCSGGFSNEELVLLARSVHACNVHSRAGLREVSEDMVYSLYDKAKVPECLTKLATGHSSLKIDDWDGYVISTCIHKDDIFLFVGYLSHIRQFCTFNDISTDSMGIVGIQLGNSMMAPVHTNNPELEHNAFVFVG